MSKRNQQASHNAQNAGKEVRKGSKVTKSESEVVMLENVMHDGDLFKKGDRVTLPPDVFSLFVSKHQAAAVEVADSDSKSDSDSQSQGAGEQTNVPAAATDADKAPEAGNAAGASDANDVKTEDQKPSNQ